MEGRDWANRSASRFVLAGGLRWHVQIMGSGPTLLLLHGAGAATHSWRDLAPILASNFTVVAPDLPGHGFTDTPAARGLSLEGMARSVSRLMDVLDIRPVMAVGHSAGAAIALWLRLDARIGDAGVVSLNGALQPFKGAAGHIFPAIAKLLFLNPVAIQMFAWRAARPGAVGRLLENTGSTIDAAGLDYYGRLLRTTGHVEGALGMMANWDLRTLLDREGGLPGPLTLVVGEKDHAVPPSVGQTIAAITPGAMVLSLPGLGHLAHEEAPDRIATIVRDAFAKS